MGPRRPARTAAAAAFAYSLAATGLPAQVVVDARAGVSVGHYGGAFSGVDAAPAAALALSVGYAFGRLHTVANYERMAFGCMSGFCMGSDVRYLSAGPSLGLRFAPPGDRPAPRLEVDIGRHTLSARWRQEDGARRSRSEAAWSWGASAGLNVPLRPRLSMTPALRLRGYRTRLGEGRRDYRVYVAAADVAIRYRW